MEELLIKLVKEHPMLYERQRTIPKDAINIRTDLWDQINKKMAEAGYELKHPVDAKKTWEKLRDRFVHAVKRFQTRKSYGLERESEPTWRLYKQMKWLIPHCNMRDRPNTRKSAAEGDLTSSPDMELGEVLSQIDETPPSSVVQPPAITISSVGTVSSEKKRKHTETTGSGNLGATLTSSPLVNKQRDESLVFAKMVEAQHRLLTPSQRQFFLHKVQAAYMEALTYKVEESVAELETTCYLD